MQHEVSIVFGGTKGIGKATLAQGIAKNILNNKLLKKEILDNLGNLKKNMIHPDLKILTLDKDENNKNRIIKIKIYW